MNSHSLPVSRAVLMIMAACLAAIAGSAAAIGIRTHAEIGRMAVETYLKQDGPVADIAGLFDSDENLRALYAGCAFPDWGFGGIYPDASEFSHWHRFMESYMELLERRFPPPWNAGARRQIAFFLGVLCHNMADIPWHFDEDGHRSFLTAGFDADGAGHGNIEFACDMFLYAEKTLEPAVGLGLWYPMDLVLEVLSQTGYAVTADQVAQGMFRAGLMFFGGPLLGTFQFHRLKAGMSWVYTHYGDYYYGGMAHNAALTAVMARYVYARLNGDYYYQNTPPYADYVRRNNDYVSRLHVEDATFVPGYPDLWDSTGPYIEVGGPDDKRRHGLIRVDLRDVPAGTDVERAYLWLHTADAGAMSGVEVTARRLSKSWDVVAGGEAETGPGEAVPVASVILKGQKEGWVKLDISEAVKVWIADPTANYGVLLHVTSPGGAPITVRMYSSEVFQLPLNSRCGGEHVAWRPAVHILTRK